MISAVIQSGGKQYIVESGRTVRLDRLPDAEGTSVTFSDVLLVADEAGTAIGTPQVAGASVTGKVVKQGRHKKVFGVKIKAKKRYLRYFGHKQHFTEVKIIKIATT